MWGSAGSSPRVGRIRRPRPSGRRTSQPRSGASRTPRGRGALVGKTTAPLVAAAIGRPAASRSMTRPFTAREIFARGSAICAGGAPGPGNRAPSAAPGR